MKKYLLFAFGNFKDESMVTYITDAISDITMTNKLKFKALDGSIVVHFGTSKEFKKIEEYCNLVLIKCCNYHFLMEYNNNLSVNLPENQKDIFLSLDNKYDKKEVKKEDKNKKDELGQVGKDILNFLNFGFFKPNEEECFDDDDILIKKSVKKEYNLDDILDKINEKGVSSLTKEENEYLKNLSK